MEPNRGFFLCVCFNSLSSPAIIVLVILGSHILAILIQCVFREIPQVAVVQRLFLKKKKRKRQVKCTAVSLLAVMLRVALLRTFKVYISPSSG